MMEARWTGSLILACITLWLVQTGGLEDGQESKVQSDVLVAVNSKLSWKVNERGRRGVGKAGTTAEDIASFLNAHNVVRRRVDPPASNMEEMTWDATLASQAQARADNCTSFAQQRYRDAAAAGFQKIGQTVGVSSGREHNITNTVNSWEYEKSMYNVTTNVCNGACENYIQLVWHNSSKVGCGIAFCTHLDGGAIPNVNLIVCNYGEGALTGHRAYTSGNVCSECPADFPLCNDKLCAQITYTTQQISDSTEQQIKETEAPNNSHQVSASSTILLLITIVYMFPYLMLEIHFFYI